MRRCAVPAQFLDHAGAHIHILMLSRQEHGIQFRIDLAVDHSHLKLILKVGAGAKSLNDDAASFSSGIFCQKLVGGIHLHIGNVSRHPANQVNPLFLRKHRLLSTVDHHADDQSIKNICSPADDIQMTAGNRVKAARINGDFHNRSPILAVYGKQRLAVFIVF